VHLSCGVLACSMLLRFLLVSTILASGGCSPNSKATHGGSPNATQVFESLRRVVVTSAEGQSGGKAAVHRFDARRARWRPDVNLQLGHEYWAVGSDSDSSTVLLLGADLLAVATDSVESVSAAAATAPNSRELGRAPYHCPEFAPYSGSTRLNAAATSTPRSGSTRMIALLGNYALLAGPTTLTLSSSHCLPGHGSELTSPPIDFLERVLYAPHSTSEPIMFGWEFESQGLNAVVGLYEYRPAGEPVPAYAAVQGSSWDAIPIATRALILSQELQRVTLARRQNSAVGKETEFYLRKAFRDQYQQLAQTLEAKTKPRYVDFDLNFFPERLSAESELTWEIMSTAPSAQYATVRKQIIVLAFLQLYLEDNPGNFHHHITFPFSGVSTEQAQAYAAIYLFHNEDNLVRLWHDLYVRYNASMQEFLRAPRAHPDFASTVIDLYSQVLSPSFRTVIDDDKVAIVNAFNDPQRLHADLKHRDIGFRTQAPYYDQGRYGMEVRAGGKDLAAQQWHVERLVYRLVQPYQSMVTPTRYFAWRDLYESEFLSSKHYDQLAIEDRISISQFEKNIQSDVPIERVTEMFLLPLVDWSSRPFIPASHKTTLDRAKQNYLEKLRTLRAHATSNNEIGFDIPMMWSLMQWAYEADIVKFY
jgi:hypothetical protein